MKYLTFLTALIILISCNSNQTSLNDKTVISVSILPQKYFVEQIAGDLVEVNVLIPPGASPATYEPTVSQLQGLGKSKIYMRIGYIAFEMAWMDNLQAINKDMSIIDISKGIDLIAEQAHRGHHQGGVDPHVWLSPRNAMILSENIYKALINQFPEKKEFLKGNYLTFQQKVDSLDKLITRELESVEQRAFMTYHPSLSYFARDYGFQQYPLEREGKSPSSAHIKYLADLGKEEDIKILFLQMQFNQHNAEVLANEIGAKIVQINPLDPEWFDQMIFIMEILKSEVNE